MANEPEKPDNEAEWKMPEPVFRSSDGQDLRAEQPAIEIAFAGNEDTTEIPGFKMEEHLKQTGDPATEREAERAIEKEVKGDKLGMSMTAIGLAALLGAAVIFLLFYFLFFRQSIPDAP